MGCGKPSRGLHIEAAGGAAGHQDAFKITSAKTPGMDVFDARRVCLSHQNLAAPMALSSIGYTGMIVVDEIGVK